MTVIIVMTLSVLEGDSPIASLFKCDVFAFVLLLLDLFLCYMYVRYVQINR